METPKSINVRFTDEEWSMIEKTRLNFGVKTRGNLIRFLLIPKIREMQQEAITPVS